MATLPNEYQGEQPKCPAALPSQQTPPAPDTTPPAGAVVLTFKEVAKLVRRCERKLRDMIIDREFPPPLSGYGRSRVWLRSTVMRWLEDRALAAEATLAPTP